MPAIGIPGRLSIQIGGATFYDLTNLKAIQAVSYSSTRWTTFCEPFTTAGYQVPASKTLRCLAYAVQARNVNALLDFGYADTDVGLHASSIPAGLITTFPDASVGCIAIVLTGTGSDPNQYQSACRWQVPTTKYPTLIHFSGGGGTTADLISMFVYGYEV